MGQAAHSVLLVTSPALLWVVLGYMLVNAQIAALGASQTFEGYQDTWLGVDIALGTK